MGDLTIFAPLRLEAAAARRGAVTATVRRTGMGSRRAVRAAADACADAVSGPAAMIGLCGALVPDLHPGDVVVASAVLTADGAVRHDLPGAELLAAELREAGLPAQTGPIVSADRIVTGSRRAELADRAVAVDMESAWFVDGLARGGPRLPVAVVRVVTDTADSELWSRQTPTNLVRGRRRIAETVPTLERWAQATGSHDVLLAGPRSFCAGVDRAIEVVERALERFGAPVYVRRQIIHNTHVVRELEARGAVFVQEVDEVPAGSVVVFAAHGVSPEVRARADELGMRVIDATCPLVAKVHSEARRFAAKGYDIALIGHHDHEEVEGTVGEAPGNITVLGSDADVDRLVVEDPERVAYLTQTTLAVGETQGMVDRLRRRFPALAGPRSDDICYATQNRQEAVVAVSGEVEVVLVVGSANSSNSRRLVEVAERAGCRAHLIDGVEDIRLDWLHGVERIGLTAGASAPESKVQEVVAAIAGLGPTTVEERTVHTEAVRFRLPQEVR